METLSWMITAPIGSGTVVEAESLLDDLVDEVIMTKSILGLANDEPRKDECGKGVWVEIGGGYELGLGLLDPPVIHSFFFRRSSIVGAGEVQSQHGFAPLVCLMSLARAMGEGAVLSFSDENGDELASSPAVALEVIAPAMSWDVQAVSDALEICGLRVNFSRMLQSINCTEDDQYF